MRRETVGGHSQRKRFSDVVFGGVCAITVIRVAVVIRPGHLKCDEAIDYDGMKI